MSETEPDPIDPQHKREERAARNVPPPGETDPPASRPLKRPRRRRWPWVLLGVVLVLILLVVLAPMIAGTAPVRAFVVGRINQNLNGRVTIDDWKLGWFSGIRVTDLRLYDERNAQIAHLPLITTELTLLDAVRGNYALGNTEVNVASFVARVDEQGRSNFEKLAKEPPRETPAAPDARPAALPNVSGRIVLNIEQGTVEAHDNPPVHVGQSAAVLNIASINQPIENDIKLTFRVADQDPGTFTANGTVDIAENNQLRLENVSGDQRVGLSNVNLAAAAPLVPRMQLGGVGNGSLDIRAAQGLAGISAQGEIVVDNFLAGGELLNGDTFRTSRLAVPVQVTRSTEGQTTVIRIERLGVQMPEATLAVTGYVPEQALQNLLNRTKPGASGNLQININIDDIAAVANQLPNTLRLEEGVRITGGKFAQVSNITLQPDNVNVAQTVDLSAQGTNNGRPVQLSPIHLESVVTVIPTGEAMPILRDLRLALDSAFATIKGGGDSLAAMKINGSFDLDRLRNEAAQFADLGDVQLAGTGDFEIATSGDPTRQAEPIAANARLNLNNLTVAGLGAQPIRQDRLALVASGNWLRDQNLLRDGSLAVTSGDPASPLLDMHASANLNLNDNSVPRFDLTKLNITDLARAQQQFGGFVPALAEQNIRIESGQLSATAGGSFDGTTVRFDKPLAVSLPNLTVSREGRPILSRETLATQLSGTISLPEAGFAGNLTELSVTTQSKLLALNKAGPDPLIFSIDKDGALRGNGALALAADIKRLNDIAQNFGGEVVAPDQPQLHSGLFNGTVTLAKADRPQTNIDFTGELTQLTVTGAQRGNALENERVTIALKAVVPDDLAGDQPLTAEGKINSTFAETTLADVRVRPGAGTWDRVQSAKVNARVPDLPKLYTLINALTPPAAPPQRASAEVLDAPVLFAALIQPQDEPVRGDESISRPRPAAAPQPAAPPPAPPEPLAPLELTSGGATLALEVKRDAKTNTTTLNLTDARVSRLALRRGQRTYAFDREQPISLKLAAQINAADDPSRPEQTLAQQIKAINITQLSGDLRVAALAMPQPIVITNLAADNPSAKGAVRVEGELGRLTPLLSVLQGADPLPYAGAYVATQNLATEGNQISLDGEIAATKFQVLDPNDRKQVVFSEDKLTVRNAITADQTKKLAEIRALNVEMASSGALRMAVTGFVENWGEEVDGAAVLASLRDVNADVTYDLERVWPIIRPFVATTEEPLDDVQVAGKHQKRFTINGPYYAGELHEAIRQIQLFGDLTVDRFVYSGMDVQKLEIPVYLRRGVLETVYAGRPAAERMPPPASFNGGTLSIGGIRLDLTQPDPRITIPEKYRLVSNASINPLLGDALGKYVNPMFPNSERAQGLLDVTVMYAQNVALGEKLRGPESGRARIVFSLTDMDIANPLGSLMFGAIPGVSFAREQAETFRGSIKDAVVTLENGRTTQDITVQLVDPGRARDVIGAAEKPREVLMPMRFQGEVNLSNLSQSINVSLPTELIGRFLRSDRDRENLARIFPQGVPLSLRGTTTNTKVDAGNIAQRFIEGQLKGLIEPSPDGGAGGLLEDLLKRRERDRDRQREPKNP